MSLPSRLASLAGWVPVAIVFGQHVAAPAGVKDGSMAPTLRGPGGGAGGSREDDGEDAFVGPAPPAAAAEGGADGGALDAATLAGDPSSSKDFGRALLPGEGEAMAAYVASPTAIDLGPPGRDKIFGFGLVNAAPAC